MDDASEVLRRLLAALPGAEDPAAQEQRNRLLKAMQQGPNSLPAFFAKESEDALRRAEALRQALEERVRRP